MLFGRERVKKCPRCGGEMYLGLNVLSKLEYACSRCKYYEVVEPDC